MEMYRIDRYDYFADKFVGGNTYYATLEEAKAHANKKHDFRITCRTIDTMTAKKTFKLVYEYRATALISLKRAKAELKEESAKLLRARSAKSLDKHRMTIKALNEEIEHFTSILEKYF